MHRTAALLTAAFFLGCGGKVVLDEGFEQATGGAGAGGGNTAGSSSQSSVASTGTGTSGDCSGIGNDCCATAIDATAGGIFDGTTCGADATFATTGQCGPIGSPDAFYVVNPPGGFYAYQIDVTPGFYVMTTAYPETCDAPSGCPFDGSSGVMYGESALYVAVQRQDGQCGAFTISFKPASPAN